MILDSDDGHFLMKQETFKKLKQFKTTGRKTYLEEHRFLVRLHTAR